MFRAEGPGPFVANCVLDEAEDAPVRLEGPERAGTPFEATFGARTVRCEVTVQGQTAITLTDGAGRTARTASPVGTLRPPPKTSIARVPDRALLT